MKNNLNINLKDIKTDLSLSKSRAVLKDDNGYFRGRLQKIELVEVDYIDDVPLNIHSERTVDEGKKIQLAFNFNLFTENDKEPISKKLLTGTNFSKEPIVQKYKSRGNKEMKNIFNRFTEICLRLGFVSTSDFKTYDDLLSEKIEKTLQNYKDRSEEEKVLIPGRFIDGHNKRVIDIFELTRVKTIEYKENIPQIMQYIKEDVNRGIKK